MIELNKKTQQDFLNREWVQKLLEAGVDMSDAKYYILHTVEDEYDCGPARDFIVYKKQVALWESENPVPTYSTAELLYKLNEWPSIEIDELDENGEKKLIGAPLEIWKDAPFYFAAYYFSVNEKNPEYVKHDVECMAEYPIETLARLLIASAKGNFHNFKYTKDISGK